jgi:hypothetical protein
VIKGPRIDQYAESGRESVKPGGTAGLHSDLSQQKKNWDRFFLSRQKERSRDKNGKQRNSLQNLPE